MKYLPFFFALFFLPIFNSCHQSTDKNCICPEYYAPVCGVDGVTYSNECFARCASVSFTPGLCETVRDGKVQFLGEPAVDGCGWVIAFLVNANVTIVRPDKLADDFKIDRLPVRVTYRNTSDSSLCGFGPYIPVIRILKMERR